MSRLIDADALIKEITEVRCVNCDRRKGMKKGKMTFVYEIGEVPCRACDVMDMIDVLDEATTVGGWISVKDRLPETAGYKCLVSAVNCFGQMSVFTAFTGYGEPGWWTNDKTHMRREIDEADNRLSPVWKVTHWMPLPEPPKEVSGDE